MEEVDAGDHVLAGVGQAGRLGGRDEETHVAPGLQLVARLLNVGLAEIQSRDLDTNRVLKLTSVSNKPLEQGYLRIPREYKKVEPGEQAAANPSK